MQHMQPIAACQQQRNTPTEFQAVRTHAHLSALVHTHANCVKPSASTTTHTHRGRSRRHMKTLTSTSCLQIHQTDLLRLSLSSKLPSTLHCGEHSDCVACASKEQLPFPLSL